MLRVMTYNLKYPSETESNRWSVRRPLVAEVIDKVGAQVFGTQEGHYFQLREIAADTATPYEWIGLGRNGGSHGEFAAIFFDPAVLEPVEYDHFWISETPTVVASQFPGTHLPRMATWIRFAIPESGRQLVVLNTHLDHESDAARIHGARQIAERIKDFDLPVVITGDFNCAAGHSAAFSALTDGSGLTDAWGPGNGPDCGTYGGWKAPEPGGHRIDWILTRGIDVADADISDYHADQQWPSDHVPAWADLLL